MDIPTIYIWSIIVFHHSFSLLSEDKRWPSKRRKSPYGRRKFSNTTSVIVITNCIESICAFPQCALRNLMPAAEDCQGARLQTDGITVGAELLFWAPFVLCFLSTPFHAVTSPISKKEECAKAGEIAIFCFGSTHKNTGILSHWTVVFCANGNDPPE